MWAGINSVGMCGVVLNLDHYRLRDSVLPCVEFT